MDEQSKQRLVGATVLASLGALVVSVFLVSTPDIETTSWRHREYSGDERLTVKAELRGEVNEAIAPAMQGDDPGGNEVSDYPTPVTVQEIEPLIASAPVEPPIQGPSASDYATIEEASNTSPGQIEKSANRAKEEAGEVEAGKSKKWVVQVGSFSKEQNAIALRDRLRESGYHVFLEPAKVSKRSLTRVYVGPESKRDDAVASRQKLQHETKLKGIVRPYLGG